MDAHPFGATMRRRPIRWLIGLLLLFSITCGFFVTLPLFNHPSTAHAAGGVQINAGGPAVSPFSADTDFTGGAASSSGNTISSSGVTNPAPQAVYQSDRVGPSFSYTIPNLSAGTAYTVRLHFAETYWTQTGKRVFNVSINNQQVLTNFDIVAAAGGANIATIKEFSSTASSSGTITIQFTSVVDQAQINGIEVLGATPTTGGSGSGGIQINAGGGTASPFVADTDFNGGATAGTSNTISTGGVGNPAPQAVYQSNRYGNFTYTIPNLTAGASYTVRLHFAETYWTQAGQRVFNVSINNQQVLSNFDIIAAAGGANIAVVKQVSATADSSGKITIQFVTVKDNAQVNGIEVLGSGSITTPTPTPTATPTPNLVAWPVFDGNAARTGINSAETTITPNNVGQLSKLWQQTLPGVVDGVPVEQPNVTTSAGIKTLLFVTTKSGSILAIDAATGITIWSKNTSGPNYTTSSPAIDPSGQFVYSYGLDGKVHKYAIGTGAEATNSPWPVTVTQMPNVEKGSSPLNIGNGYLYMPIGGYFGDGGHYEGHVVAVNLSSGAVTVFNALCANIKHVLGPNDCPDVQSAIWGRGAPVIDPVTGNVFVTTGNGPFRGDGLAYGDSVIELSPDLSTIIDSYTPSNYAFLQSADQDLGSTDPLMLPKQPNSKTPYMAVQAGKDNVLRLLNRQNLSGQGGPNHVGGELQTVSIPQGGDVDTQPVAWTDASGMTWVFVANFNGFDAYKVITNAQGQTTLQLAYQNGNSGSSPFIANNILFVQGNNVLRAMDPTTGNVLWSSSQASAGGNIGGLHWESPIVVNGHVYVTDESGKLFAYGLH